MKAAATSFILVTVIFASSCIPSLNPLYTEHDLVFDASLVGVWTETETGETWALSKRDKLEYRLIHTDTDGIKGAFSARLVKLGDNLFLDIVPIKPGFTQNDFYKTRFFPTHTFVHIAIDRTGVKLSYLEPAWVADYLSENPDALRHEKIAGDLLLTSSPKEMQKFLLAHLTTRGAFSKPTELMLKRGAQ